MSKYISKYTGAEIEASVEAYQTAQTEGKGYSKNDYTDTDKSKLTALQQTSNRNLLDNAWFTVNQRGQSSYSGSGYTVDRWVNLTQGTVEVVDNGIKLTCANNSTLIINRIDPCYNNSILGKTVTLSVILEHGEIKKASYTLPSVVEAYSSTMLDLGNNWYSDILFSTATNLFGVRLRSTTTDATITVKAVKLELGTISTLHLDTAPNYAEELAKCQRYDLTLNTMGSSYGCVGSGLAETTTICPIDIPTPTSMRIAGTVKFNGNWSLYDGGTSYAVTNITMSDRYSNNMITVYATSSGLTAKKAYLLRANNDASARINISADL